MSGHLRLVRMLCGTAGIVVGLGPETVFAGVRFPPFENLFLKVIKNLAIALRFSTTACLWFRI